MLTVIQVNLQFIIIYNPLKVQPMLTFSIIQLLYPLQNRVLGAYTVSSMSVIPKFRPFVSI